MEEMLLQFSLAGDSLGVPMISEKMVTIWEKKRVECIQDPPGVSLYTVTAHIKKGGVKLPVLGCARGTTSLESLYLHMANFTATFSWLHCINIFL